MNSIHLLVQETLTEGGYDVMMSDTSGKPITLFENDSLLGFVFVFSNPSTLLEQWRETSQSVIKTKQFALRRAEQKAWNTYLVLLAETPANYGQKIKLSEIEEDLVGTRKIAAAGIANGQAIQDALLPLLPLQSAPRIDSVDMSSEIRLRTSELPVALMDAFLNESSEGTLNQLLENE